MRFLSRLKKELFYLRKAFFQYHAGSRYLYNKYFIAPTILKSRKVFATETRSAAARLSLHILTGRGDLVLCLWSLASFFTHTSLRGRLYVHDDGTLRPNDLSAIGRMFPRARVVSPPAAAAAAEEFYRGCPRTLALRRGGRFVLLKKLLDPHAVSKSPMRLVIDSDLVWFKEPKELALAFLKGLPRPMMMRNLGANHVRFQNGETLTAEQAGLNSGIVMFRPGQFSLSRLEEYFGKLDLDDARTPHFIEQAGYAYALDAPQGLPHERYTIKGGFSASLALKHYTSPRRPLFYLEALPKIERLIKI